MQEVKVHTALGKSVIKTLLYFDIFNYPLKANEVFNFLGMNTISERDVIHSLYSLAEHGLVYQFGEFFGINPDEGNVRRRVKGNAEAERCLPIAYKMGRLIAGFPFVRGVLASGSLSKNYMDKNSDLDFFIITQPNRLWICRTLLIIYKRIFLLNSHKFFCINYLVDSEHLEIEEKNIFTATELATVIPLYGAQFYKDLHQKNQHWLLEYFPNFQIRDFKEVPQYQRGFLKKLVEKFIDIFFGNNIEKYCMKINFKRWKNLYEKSYHPDDFEIAFKSKKYASKSHPQNFQKKVIEQYNLRMKKFCSLFEFDLTP